MGGINKYVCGVKLLPMTVSAFAVNRIRFCHLVKTQHRCLCPCGMNKPPPSAHPPPHPPNLPPANPSLIHVICDITVAMKKLLKSSSVSFPAEIVINIG